MSPVLAFTEALSESKAAARRREGGGPTPRGDKLTVQHLQTALSAALLKRINKRAIWGPYSDMGQAMRDGGVSRRRRVDIQRRYGLSAEGRNTAASSDSKIRMCPPGTRVNMMVTDNFGVLAGGGMRGG